FPAALALGQSAPTPEEIAKAVEQLGDRRFAVREKASAFLAAAGKAAEPALRDALKSRDSEVVRRAQVILDQFRWGLYPDTPKEFVDLIRRYQSADGPAKQRVIRDLLGQGDKGYPFLLKIATAEDDVYVRQFLFETIEAEVSRLIPARLLNGGLDAA